MNGHKIIDLVRRTNAVKASNFYMNLFKSDDINSVAMKMQRDNLVSQLIRLRENNFYRQFLENISDNEIKEKPYEVLERFPIADKKMIKEHFNEIRNLKWRGENAYTGGSTGTPFHYIVDKRLLTSVNGFTLFLWHYLADYNVNDNVIVVGGTSIGDRKNLKKCILHYFQKRTYISGGDINIDNAKRLVSSINKAKKPLILYGYPSSICEYIGIIQKRGLIVDYHNIKSIITTSETLSPYKRTLIEDSFGKKVVNLYGARDGGISAGSIDEKTFIYNGIDCYAENIEYDGEKELVLTNLHCDSFPFIRYRIGDIADLRISKIGYPFILSNLFGRTRDFVSLPNGNKIHGSKLNKLFSHYRIEEYQITQYKNYSCSIVITEESRINIENLIKDIKTILPSIDYNVKVVDAIPRQSNNKLRNIISEIE